MCGPTGSMLPPSTSDPYHVCTRPCKPTRVNELPRWLSRQFDPLVYKLPPRLVGNVTMAGSMNLPQCEASLPPNNQLVVVRLIRTDAFDSANL